MIASLPSTLVAITPLSSPRTQRACASWCPAFMPLSVELTVMSLRLLRCAPSPLRVPGRVLGVGSLRTLSRPDTSPGFYTWSLHSFGFHLLSLPGALTDTGCSCSAALLRGGPLRRSRPLAISTSVAVWVNQGVALPGCPLSPDGHHYVHPAVPTLLPIARLKQEVVHQLYVSS